MGKGFDLTVLENKGVRCVYKGSNAVVCGFLRFSASRYLTVHQDLGLLP